MVFPRTRFLFPLSVAAFFLPAQAQQIIAPISLNVNNTSPAKIAYLLDPAHNAAPTDPFALWPGLPSLGSLSPSAARLFVPAPKLVGPLHKDVISIVPDENNPEHEITVTIRTSPNVMIAPGTPLGDVTEKMAWIDQRDTEIDMGGYLWRFKPTDALPEDFAQMLKDWDHKTPVVQPIDFKKPLRDFDKSSRTYRFKSQIPTEMEFHANERNRNGPIAPEDHVRVTVVRVLREGETYITSDTPLSVLIESPTDLFEPVIVRDFLPKNQLLVLLPEKQSDGTVRATFFDLYLWAHGNN